MLKKNIIKMLGYERFSNKILNEIEQHKFVNGQILVRLQKEIINYKNLSELEFKVFSQYGDDGIIQFLINKLPIKSQLFIEFGVEDYHESNTRFLLMNNNWKGLVIDGSLQNINLIKKESISWRYDLTAIHSFITKDNINEIFTNNGFIGEIGILSIDIDGNDYWVWKNINTVKPAIVIAEYNSVFGAEHAITVPYIPEFERSKYHYSCLCWGASLKALNMLANEKGYYFVGCNSAGNNAYFVSNEYKNTIKEISIEKGFVCSKFRESRDDKGNLTFLSGNDRLNVIKDCLVYHIEKNKNIYIREII